MKTLHRTLTCALLGAAALFLLEAALLMRAAVGTAAALPHEIALTRSALLSELRATRQDLISQIQAARQDVLDRSERQVIGLRRDLLSETSVIAIAADRRLGDTLQRADAALATLDSLRQDLKPAIDNAASAEQSASTLLDTYRALPSQLGAQFAPSWEKLQPEITCRLATGAGYGGCWHSRVTALLGEAANAGGVFTKKFPSFADSATGIAADVHTFTAKTVKPRGFWGTFKDFLSAGSGVARAAGAAGLFDIQTAAPPYR
jgi:hypothetical protein